ncbi:hypothetical protein [Candidatus Proelusimicrobium volucris]|uniref:hypothetical protein n=1 Tax=Candidatus Proelusimicrobium volucris TaxID=3416225 RepID=UPI003D1072D3
MTFREWNRRKNLYLRGLKAKMGKFLFDKKNKNRFKTNRIKYNNYPRNIHGPRTILDFRQTLLFDSALLFDDICYFLKYPKYYLRRKKSESYNLKNIRQKKEI